MGFLADKAGEAPRSPAQEAQAAAAPEVFQVTIQRLKFHNNDTGFFIAEAVAAGPVPRLPADILELGVRLPSTILLRGTSQSFQGTDQIGATLEVAGEWSLDPPRYTHGDMGDGISSWAMRL